jgi:hypothetical protein
MAEKYLTTVSDTVTMDKQTFVSLMRRFRHHRNVSYGFSRKHTNDIMEYRKRAGLSPNDTAIPGDMYQLPVVWNTDITYVK